MKAGQMEDGRKGSEAPVRDASSEDRLEACPRGTLEEAIEGLSGCADDALSQAACQGILDPAAVVAWTDRTERLLRFRFDRSELRAEVPAVADELRGLLREVDLPDSVTPESITASFVESLVRLRAAISEDVAAAFEGDPAASGYEEIALSYPAIRALSVHRIAHELHLAQVPLIPRIMSEYAHDRTGIDIHPGARIGKHFFIDHGTGVVIGETTVIGDRVRLYQGVTLGAKSFPVDEAGRLRRGVKRHPTLEDNVTVYAGATILGGDTRIGHGTTVNGGVFLTQSVPPNHVVRAPKVKTRLLDRGQWDQD